MSCYLCGCNEYAVRSGSVRDDSTIKILECSSCSLVYLSSLLILMRNIMKIQGFMKERPRILISG